MWLHAEGSSLLLHRAGAGLAAAAVRRPHSSHAGASRLPALGAAGIWLPGADGSRPCACIAAGRPPAPVQAARCAASLMFSIFPKPTVLGQTSKICVQTCSAPRLCTVSRLLNARLQVTEAQRGHTGSTMRVSAATSRRSQLLQMRQRHSRGSPPRQPSQQLQQLRRRRSRQRGRRRRPRRRAWRQSRTCAPGGPPTRQRAWRQHWRR
jgi:hypothetical protein